MTLRPKIIAAAVLGWLMATPAFAQDQSLIARGQYLATAADCVACHTAPGGQPFAGGLPIKTPMGTIYAPNITPDKATGIGTWTDEDFLRALHEGIGKGGKHLYPAFPYTSFAALSAPDVQAIKAYLFSLPPIRRENTPNEMKFPYNMRFLMIGWNLLNFHPEKIDPQAERGKYLADALGHCAECHSPRGLTMAMDGSQYLAGGSVDGWTAFNITSDVTHGIGSWSTEDIATYLKSGNLPGKAQAAGPMGEVIVNSTSHMSDGDLAALAGYLKTVPAKSAGTAGRFDKGQPQPDGTTTGYRTALGQNVPEGEVLFSTSCTTCHGASGEGTDDRSLPSLYHNSATGAATASNLVLAVLDGVKRKTGFNDASMPAFRDEFTDDQIAALVNYVRQSFGNSSDPVTATQVRDLRNGVQPPAVIDKIVNWAEVLVPALIVLLLIAATLLIRRRHSLH